jgi:hypothetical protein
MGPRRPQAGAAGLLPVCLNSSLPMPIWLAFGSQANLSWRHISIDFNLKPEDAYGLITCQHVYAFLVML